MFKLRGVAKGTTFLAKRGLTYDQAYRLINYRLSGAYFDLMEKACLALNCTPNDLIEWKPRTAEDDIAGHPLQKIRGRDDLDLFGMLKDVPMDRMGELKQAMAEAVEKIKNSGDK